MTAIRGFAALVQPTETVAVIPNNEPDNRIRECALAARAERLVGGDPDLQPVATYCDTTTCATMSPPDVPSGEEMIREFRDKG